MAVIPSVCFAQTSCVNGICNTSRVVSKHDLGGFNLAPGETLVSVNGVPVSQLQGPLVSAAQIVKGFVGAVDAISSRIVNRDSAAYNHALREAQILANNRWKGHPLGVAPGCSYSGTGTSSHPEAPNHCYAGSSESRLVARACVLGSDGKYYWSAHYR